MIARIVGTVCLVLLIFLGIGNLIAFVTLAFAAETFHAAFCLCSAIFGFAVAAWIDHQLYDND